MDKKTQSAYMAIAKKSGVNRRQATILYNIAKECKSPILEFGALRGRSSVALGGGSRAGNRVPVYSVDVFSFNPTRSLTPEEEAELNGIKKVDRVAWNTDIYQRHIKVAGLQDIIKMNIGRYEEFEYDGSVGLLFIDANKSREGLNIVWERYWPKIDSGGWFVTHDFNYTLREVDGVMKERFKQVKEWFVEDIFPICRKETDYVKIIDGMCMIKKP